eukprot:71832_1
MLAMRAIFITIMACIWLFGGTSALNVVERDQLYKKKVAKAEIKQKEVEAVIIVDQLQDNNERADYIIYDLCTTEASTTSLKYNDDNYSWTNKLERPEDDTVHTNDEKSLFPDMIKAAETVNFISKSKQISNYNNKKAEILYSNGKIYKYEDYNDEDYNFGNNNVFDAEKFDYGDMFGFELHQYELMDSNA